MICKLQNGRKFSQRNERKVLRIWLKFLLDRRRIQQAVRKILSGHYALVQLHNGRSNDQKVALAPI